MWAVCWQWVVSSKRGGCQSRPSPTEKMRFEQRLKEMDLTKQTSKGRIPWVEETVGSNVV